MFSLKGKKKRLEMSIFYFLCIQKNHYNQMQRRFFLLCQTKLKVLEHYKPKQKNEISNNKKNPPDLVQKSNKVIT